MPCFAGRLILMHMGHNGTGRRLPSHFSAYGACARRDGSDGRAYVSSSMRTGIVRVDRREFRPGDFGKQAPYPIRLHRCVRVVQQPIKFVEFAAVFSVRHIHLTSAGPPPAGSRPFQEYEALSCRTGGRCDQTDDITAGASAAMPAAGWPGLRNRSSPPGAASGSPNPNNSSREMNVTATTGRASGLVMN